MKCLYCRQPWEEDSRHCCRFCGAAKPEEEPARLPGKRVIYKMTDPKRMGTTYKIIEGEWQQETERTIFVPDVDLVQLNAANLAITLWQRLGLRDWRI